MSAATSKYFSSIAAGCAFASAITTLCVHLLPRLYAAAETFDQQLVAPTHFIYRLRLWIVLLHIVVVWISIAGLGLKLAKRHAGPVIVGSLGYLLFGLAELFRTSFTMFVINLWRAAYIAATSDSVRLGYRIRLEAWPEINYQLFFLLLFGFFTGNAGFAVASWHADRLSRALSATLALWACMTLTALLRDYVGLHAVPALPEWTSWTFQPAARLLIGFWILRNENTAGQVMAATG